MTSLTDKQLIEKFNILPSDKILDIGGSAKQHDLIQIDTIVDILKPEKVPYSPSSLTARHFVQLDITREKLPFKDKQFDFCLCTHTLEDLDTPFLILEEMSRVSKRGYISTPSRGEDSVFSRFNITDWMTGPRRLPGFAHHQWFFELTGNTMFITPKNYPLLYTRDFCIGKWMGEEEFQYYWKDKIKFKAFDDFTNFHALIKNYRKFMTDNSALIKKSTPLIFIDNPIYIVKELLKLLLKRGEGFKL